MTQYEEYDSDSKNEYQNLQINDEPIIRKTIYQKVKVRKPIFLKPAYIGKNYQTINHDVVYKHSSQQNNNGYSLPTITPVEDDDYNELANNQNEYIENSNNTNSLNSIQINNYFNNNNLNVNNNDFKENENNTNNYLNDNQNPEVGNEYNYNNNEELLDSSNYNNQNTIQAYENPNNEYSKWNEKPNINYIGENLNEQNIDEGEISKNSEPLDEDIFKKGTNEKIQQIEKKIVPITKIDISTQTDDDNINCLYNYNNIKRYVQKRNYIDDQSNFTHKAINKDGFQTVKIIPKYKIKNYNNFLKNKKHNINIYFNPVKKVRNITNYYSIDNNYFRNRIKKVFMPNNYYNSYNIRKIRLNPIYGIPNGNRTINNRYDNNTINFNNISEIKYKNEQDISNSSEIDQKRHINEKYEKGIRFDKYKKIDKLIESELKEEDIKPNLLRNNDYLDIFDNNFDHHEKFIEKMKNIFD